MPIVFCGIEFPEEIVFAGLAPITDVTETFGKHAVVETALKLHPSAKQLVVVNNQVRSRVKDEEGFCDIFRDRIK